MTVTLIATSNFNYLNVVTGQADELWLLAGVTISRESGLVIAQTGPGTAFISDGAILALTTDAGLTMRGAGESLVFGAASIYRSAASVETFSIASTGGTNSVSNLGLISPEV